MTINFKTAPGEAIFEEYIPGAVHDSVPALLKSPAWVHPGRMIALAAGGFAGDGLSVRTTALEMHCCGSRPDCGIVRTLTEVLKHRPDYENGELLVLLGENS